MAEALHEVLHQAYADATPDELAPTRQIVTHSSMGRRPGATKTPSMPGR
jgi:hypothetical protein